MSVISSRKSLNSSILKSSVSRADSLKKSKILRFELDTCSVKEILKDLETNPDVKSYQNLIYKLTDSRLEEIELRKIISDTHESVSILNKDHILLIQTLLDIRWISKSYETIEIYHKFLFHLMTSKTEFLVLCLSRIMRCFIPNDDECLEYVNGYPPVEIEKKVNLVHELLKKLFDTVPLIKYNLGKIIRPEFPFYKQSHVKIVAFIDNLLKILDYCACITHDILELIFENILLIDVNVTKEQIDESEEQETDEISDEDSMKLPLAETLDYCMDRIFKFLNTKFSDDSTCSQSDKQLITDTIFEYFDEHIIKTFTKHFHFFMFYLASFNKQFMDKFLDFLWKKINDRGQSVTIRQTVIGYLASFISRAKFLRIDVLKIFLNRLCAWTHNYIKNCDYERNRNPKAHVIFYSMFQAICYIIAFRSRELTGSELNLKFLLQLNLWPIVKHPLNPLHVCIPAIVTVFDNVTSKYQILFCHAIIVSNASKCLTTVYANEQHRPEEILETIFPFDPYLLKKSGKMITPLYIEYQGIEDDQINSNSPNRQRVKRTRNISTSHDFDDFIIFEGSKKMKQN